MKLNEYSDTSVIVSGVVVTLSTNETLAREAVRQLRSHQKLTVGEEWGRWIPVSIEADHDSACRDLHDWISSRPGVIYVDVVAVTFENEIVNTFAQSGAN